MAELLATLTPRLQRQADTLLEHQQLQTRWHNDLPVLLLRSLLATTATGAGGRACPGAAA